MRYVRFQWILFIIALMAGTVSCSADSSIPQDSPPQPFSDVQPVLVERVAEREAVIILLTGKPLVLLVDS